MALKRIILEMGTGNDLHGQDYTKAAMRAVDDALHHCSLALFRSLEIDPSTMQIDVTIGVQEPDAVDCSAVGARLPYGTVHVRTELGGLNVPAAESRNVIVVATAAIDVRLELPETAATGD
ncbi:MAG: Lin0512 family protein [Burkholderiaceae bacterium]|nr:Lin0512 family protein [Burkholderiaceae bacterium]